VGGARALRRPRGTQAVRRRAHELGLGVVLDVVHNHLGPSGNYLPAFGPYFTDTHQTPWGSRRQPGRAGSDEVRAYLLGSALAGCATTTSTGCGWTPCTRCVDTRASTCWRSCPSRSTPCPPPGPAAVPDRRVRPQRPAAGHPRARRRLGLHAQWDDDFHHALHTALTGESAGLLRDFGPRSRASPRRAHRAASSTTAPGRASGAAMHGRPVDRTAWPRTGSSATAEPRPDRQPRPGATGFRRPSPPACSSLRRHAAADLAVHADAVHGRGVGGGQPLAVLHRPPRAGPRRGRTAGQAAGVRGARLGRGGRARPAGPGDPRPLLPRLVRAAEVLAAWEPVEAPGADGLLRLPGESCVVLAQA
jgi:hypothetical protein